jgi:hypothetical protein
MFLPVCQLRIILQHRRRLRVLCEFEIFVVNEISELVKASWVSEATVLFLPEACMPDTVCTHDLGCFCLVNAALNWVTLCCITLFSVCHS